MFSGIEPTRGVRQQVQGGYVQIPSSESSGSPFSSLLGLAGLATSFIPGAQAASPFLTGAAQVASGDWAGAAKTGAGVAQGLGSSGEAESAADMVVPDNQIDADGNDTAPPEPYTAKKLDDYAEDSGSLVGPGGIPIDIQEYFSRLFMANPYLLMQSLIPQQGMVQQYLNNGPGGILPNQGFSQFGPQGVS